MLLFNIFDSPAGWSLYFHLVVFDNHILPAWYHWDMAQQFVNRDGSFWTKKDMSNSFCQKLSCVLQCPKKVFIFKHLIHDIASARRQEKLNPNVPFKINILQQSGPVDGPQSSIQYVARASTRGAFQLGWEFDFYLMIRNTRGAP